MPKTESVSVQKLQLDLSNFRTVKQPGEIQAIQAMISIDTDRFWALMESLLDDGYLPTENIIILETGSESDDLLVKEGNRRIAALKLIHGYLPSNEIPIPAELTTKISALSISWKTANQSVPCAIYSAADTVTVDRIVALTHGKGELAGRSGWKAIARARHNRDQNGDDENGLDLLEKYLVHGENLNRQQAKRWAGDYKLSILDEAIGRIAPAFGAKNGPELARNYPTIPNKSVLDDILGDIGVEIITFPMLRKPDFLASYMPTANVAVANSVTTTEDSAAPSPSTLNTSASSAAPPSGSGGASNETAQGQNLGATNASVTQGASGRKMAAVAIGDPRVVKRALKKFTPLGKLRQKVVTLRDEAVKLKLDDNPIAFCFLLRSMFEISAKAYCEDHKATGGPSMKKPNGEDLSLSAALEKITAHLTSSNTDTAMIKTLHGAMTELKRSSGILSVTSMNQLVHNPSFSVTANDVATLFGNIFPLLEAMNS